MNYFNYTSSLIPKGQKGWTAETMQSWSPEKMKQVLEEYGQEGLRPATYAYLNKRVNPSTATSQQKTNVMTNEQVKELQRSLGFTGKDVDGLYGEKTMKAMRQKYGTSNFAEAFQKVKQQAASVSTPHKEIPYLFTRPENKQSTTVTTSTPDTPSATKEDQQKGVDYRGQNSWTETRVAANKANSVNSSYATPQVAPLKKLPASQDEFTKEDMYFADYTKEPLVTEYGMPDYKAIREEFDANYDNQYGKGNWYRDTSGKIITRQSAPSVGHSAFTVPEEWSSFIQENQTTDRGVKHALSDNAVASFLFGDDSGFHSGNWFTGSHGSVPMYLSNEESLDDAYAKAYAAGNRRFTYDGKTYTTTSYTDAGKNYLQAVYDAEFERGRDGKVSEATQNKLNEAKSVWANDEMRRFGIDARTLGAESGSGYPVATSYNIANNVGQFGYNHGARRMMMAADGYLDLGQNNKENEESKFKQMMQSFSYPGVERSEKHSTPQRTALLKLGVSQALEEGSPELKKVTVNSKIQPSYMSSSPINYAYTVDGVTRFNPESEWEKKGSGNYTRTGKQVNGSMWNATEVYDPTRDITYIYDVNDYGFGPNSKIGWGGYAGVPVVSQSATQTKPKNIKRGGYINYTNYSK